MSLEVSFAILARAIDAVLLASHGQVHWLKPGFPPFRSAETGDRGVDATDLLAKAVAYYGGPCAALDLWIACRAIDDLSRAWTGKGLVVPEALSAVPEALPDAAGLPAPLVELVTANDEDAPWYR